MTRPAVYGSGGFTPGFSKLGFPYRRMQDSPNMPDTARPNPGLGQSVNMSLFGPQRHFFAP